MTYDIYKQSLLYHQKTPRGKLAVIPTKPLNNQHDLALAYSPGVAEPCRQIVEHGSQAAAQYTSRGNLVAVISNGTAVLGLGDIGALASKPVMEGKAILFKKFAGIDCFDIEIDEKNPDKLIDIIASLEPTFGAINLEDIKAPECFYIEQELQKRLNIPVFHDDQHGTAIIVGAAVINGLELLGKNIDEVRLVTSGAGAGAIACLNLLMELGLKRENITICDRNGIVYEGRDAQMEQTKAFFAQKTTKRMMIEAFEGADIFLGLSAANLVTQDMIKVMAPNPLVLALANPEPEILPYLVHDVRHDAIVATGRSDYPNQVNNALCFPYIFRGALDVGATGINMSMKIASVKAIAALAKAETSEFVTAAYGYVPPFGPQFIIPKPFDRRLFVDVTFAVAKAAMDSGVAMRPIENLDQYHQTLIETIHPCATVMRSSFDQVKQGSKENLVRMIFAEGEEDRVLQAVQILSDDHMGHSVLLGREDVIEGRIKSLGLRLNAGQDYSIIDLSRDNDHFDRYTALLYERMGHRGFSKISLSRLVQTDSTVAAALAVLNGDADSLICGAFGLFTNHLKQLQDILGIKKNLEHCVSMGCLVIDSLVTDYSHLFIADPFISVDPTAKDLVDMTFLAAAQVRRFGIEPKVALVSHSNFGASYQSSARKMHQALEMIMAAHPDFEVDGEMHADIALLPSLRQSINEHSKLYGAANLLIMPNLDAAHISYNLIKALGNNQSIGPIMMGLARGAQIITPTTQSRGIANMAVLAIYDVLEERKKGGSGQEV